MGVAGICSGSPAGGPPPGSLAGGGLEPQCRLGAGTPSHGPGAAGGKGSGARPQGLGGLPVLTPELGRVAATWAARQAAERSMWVLELWKATEEKRAALVALKQSEETLHQVWQQMRPPWPDPPITVPPAAPRQEGTPGSPAKGGGEVKCRSHRKQAGAQVAASLLTGGATGASETPDEPPAKGETSRPGGLGWSPSEQDAPAESGCRSRGGQE